MKHNWQYKPLGELSIIIAGQSPKGSSYNETGEGTPFYQGKKEFTDKYIGEPTTWTTSETKIALKDDILMSVRAPVGNVNISTQRICIGRGLAAIRPNIIISRDFLFHYIVAIQDSITGREGAVFPTISKKEISLITIPVPPLSEQEAIVARLDAAFERIDILRRNTEQELRSAQQLFQSTLSLLLTPQPHWRKKSLGDICNTINGLWKGKKEPFIKVGVIRNANFNKDFTLRYDNIEYLDVEERQYTKRKLHRGDIIVEKSGGSEKQPVGRAVLFDADGDFSFSNFTSILRIRDKNDINTSYLYRYLQYSYIRGDTLRMQKATTGIHNLEFDKYLSINIPIPPLAEQLSIVSRLDALSDKVKQLQANLSRTLTLCEDYKKALLREVFE